MIKWPKSYMGLDLGRRGSKGIFLSLEKNRVYLKHSFHHDNLKLSQNFPLDVDHSLGPLIFLEANNLFNSRVNFTLSHDQVHHTEIIEIPNMGEKESKLAIESELQGKLNLNLSEINYDYYKIKQKIGRPNFDSYKIFYAIKAEVEERVQLIKKCNLRTAILDIDLLAISTMLEYNGYFEDKKSYVVIDLGEGHTTLAFFINGQMILTRNLVKSVGDMSKSISSKFSISYKEAELLKEELKMKGLEGDETENIKPQSFANNYFFELVSEINQQMNFFEVYFQKWPLGGIYLVGGGGKLGELKEILKEVYDTPVVIPNPLKNIDIQRDASHNGLELISSKNELFAVAVGLALRGIFS